MSRLTETSQTAPAPSAPDAGSTTAADEAVPVVEASGVPHLERAPAVRVADGDRTRWARLSPRKRDPAARLLVTLRRRSAQASERFDLLVDGDRVLCGISGGKDSYTMLEVLLELRQRAPFDFDVGAIIVDSGFRGFDHERAVAFCAERGVETYVIHANIWETMQALPFYRSPCAPCARFRRGVLYRVAEEHGFGKLALGHHADDVIETALLNMLFGGQLRAMPPRLQSDNGPVVIRPLCLSYEHETSAYADARRFPLVHCACPADCSMQNLERKRVKAWIRELSEDFPKVRSSLLAALGNVSTASLLDPALLAARGD